MKKILTLLLSLTLTLGAVSALGGCINLSEEAGKYSTSSPKEEPEEETFTVTFKQNGEKDISVEVKSGEALPADKIPQPKAQTGYTVKWDTTDFTKITKNLTVNAVATANTYTITYNANEGEVTPATQTVTYDSAPGTFATPTRTGYDFIAWTLDGKAVLATDVWKYAKDVTLVAEWQEVVVNTYTISFVQGGETIATRTVQAGQSLAAADIPAPAQKTGYTVSWERTEFTNVTENITVNAVSVAKKYTVTLDLDGGKGDTSYEMTYDQAYTLPTPTKEGFIFGGWKDSEGKLYSTGVWEIDGTLALKAEWTAEESKEFWTPNY